MEKINVVIVDDEGINTLSNLIEKFIDEIRIIGSAETVKEGIDCINEKQPDLVFLDIKLPDGTGLDILEKCSYHDFEVVFTTAYEEFALQAIERSALHYLLKPISISKLREAIERYKGQNRKSQLKQQIETLRGDLEHSPKKIILNSADELVIVNLDDIVYVKSNGNYAEFHLNNKQMIMVSKTISHYESILPDQSFFRVHKQYILNLKHIVSFQKGRGGIAILSNGDSIEVSTRRKLEFIEHLEQFIRHS